MAALRIDNRLVGQTDFRPMSQQNWDRRFSFDLDRVILFFRLFLVLVERIGNRSLLSRSTLNVCIYCDQVGGFCRTRRTCRYGFAFGTAGRSFC